jgi:hypothetical protein
MEISAVHGRAGVTLRLWLTVDCGDKEFEEAIVRQTISNKTGERCSPYYGC